MFAGGDALEIEKHTLVRKHRKWYGCGSLLFKAQTMLFGNGKSSLRNQSNASDKQINQATSPSVAYMLDCL